MQWSPFEDRLLATCADDGKAKFWVFDDYNGLSGQSSRSDCDLELDAHSRKCISVQWHAAAENLLATHSIDKTIKIWDINEDRCDDAMITFTDMPDYCTSIRWSPDGKMLAGEVKNKTMVIFDPRQESSVIKSPGHVGPRQQRLQWADNETLITSGFDREAKRQWGAWDLRNMEQPLMQGPLIEGSGVPYLFYDREYNILIMAGRGDNTCGVYSFDKSSPTFLNLVQTYNFLNTTQKGFCLGPKHCVDVSKQEVMRSVRITNNSKIDVLAMRIPSKVGGFNAEYYPPFDSNEASSTAEAWFAGTDVDPKKMQLTASSKAAPKKKSGLNRLKTGKPAATKEEEKKDAGGSEDVAALKARIAQLQADIQAASATAGGQQAVAEDFSTKPVLGYWSIRGLAAQIRYMFYYLNIDFEDKLYECGDAPDFDKSCWFDVKETLGLEYPNLPYLIDGETKLTETVAIMQYIARKYQPALLGSNSSEIGRIHMLLDKVATLKGKATGPCYGSGDTEAIIEECRPILAKIVETMGDSQWIAGSNLTWLDFYFAELLDLLNAISDGLFHAEFPTMQTYWDRFIALPNLAEAWADDTKCMKAPFNNKMAKLLNN